MISGIVYRLATADDAAAVDAVALEASRHHHALAPAVFAPPPELARAPGPDLAALSSDSYVALAEEDGVVIGFVFAEAGREERAFLQPTSFVRINIIAVLPAHRSRGIGQALMARVERWARERGCMQARLNVWAVNSRAAMFYENLGYETMTVTLFKSLDERGSP